MPRSLDSSRETWAGTSATRTSSDDAQATSTAASKAASVNGPAPPMLGTTTGSRPVARARTSTFSPPIDVTGRAAIHCGRPGPLTTSVSAVSWAAVSSTPRGAPVEPDVVTTTATSADSSGMDGSSARTAARSVIT